MDIGTRSCLKFSTTIDHSFAGRQTAQKVSFVASKEIIATIETIRQLPFRN